MQWHDGSFLARSYPCILLHLVLLAAILRLIKRAEVEAETVRVKDAEACLNNAASGAERPTPGSGTT